MNLEYSDEEYEDTVKSYNSMKSNKVKPNGMSQETQNSITN